MQRRRRPSSPIRVTSAPKPPRRSSAPSSCATDLPHLLARADQALYVAKAAGRNTVRAADPAATDALPHDAVATPSTARL